VVVAAIVPLTLDQTAVVVVVAAVGLFAFLNRINWQNHLKVML
jgi:hypothetical protein